MAANYQRIPYLVVFDEVSAFKDTYGGAIGKVAVEAMHLKPAEPSDSVVIFSHPIGGGSWLPLVGVLAKRGPHDLLQHPLSRQRHRADHGARGDGPGRLHQGRQRARSEERRVGKEC